MLQTDFVGGFAKGLRVIEAFGEDASRLTITEVARITGLDRATTRRLLLTLSSLGYAEFDGKYFSLLPRILRLGHAYLLATQLPRIVQPFLDQLSSRVGHSASASVLDGAEIIYVARAAQQRVMSVNLMPGSRLPAYCSSMGRVLLAALSEDAARAVIAGAARPALTVHTRTDVAELMEELRRVRDQGYAVIDQEIELGLCSIAVPVLNRRGQVVAALNIGAPAAQISAARLAEAYLKDLLATQAEIRSALA